MTHITRRESQHDTKRNLAHKTGLLTIDILAVRSHFDEADDLNAKTRDISQIYKPYMSFDVAMRSQDRYPGLLRVVEMMEFYLCRGAEKQPRWNAKF